MFRQNDQNDGKQSLTIPLSFLKMKQSILGFTLDDLSASVCVNGGSFDSRWSLLWLMLTGPDHWPAGMAVLWTEVAKDLQLPSATAPDGHLQIGNLHVFLNDLDTRHVSAPMGFLQCHIIHWVGINGTVATPEDPSGDRSLFWSGSCFMSVCSHDHWGWGWMLVHHFQRQFPKDSIIDNLEERWVETTGMGSIPESRWPVMVTGQFPELGTLLYLWLSFQLQSSLISTFSWHWQIYHLQILARCFSYWTCGWKNRPCLPKGTENSSPITAERRRIRSTTSGRICTCYSGSWFVRNPSKLV